MRVAFVRHGERRKGEADPELTSFGVRMVSETGAWLRQQQFIPTIVQTTNTKRTQQTTDLLIHDLSNITQETIEDAPELQRDWERWWETLDRGKEDADILLVGHHPTMEMLLQCYGPAPCSFSKRNFAVALILQTNADGGYTITHAWPGRTSLA